MREVGVGCPLLVADHGEGGRWQGTPEGMVGGASDAATSNARRTNQIVVGRR